MLFPNMSVRYDLNNHFIALYARHFERDDRVVTSAVIMG